MENISIPARRQFPLKQTHQKANVAKIVRSVISILHWGPTTGGLGGFSLLDVPTLTEMDLNEKVCKKKALLERKQANT